ncbi:MAG: hypothetical protein JW974_03945 [Alphaproteobacteria bacterium]|nr:hypothetical protein [Alphaproteobacteria bacterium]MBN2675140.1 hypothetical protein [Alphaproteobacteria bacterium]
MKRLISSVLLLLLTVSTARAAQNYIIGNDRMVYEEKTGWYAIARADMNFLSWKNTYSSDLLEYNGYDNYSNQPVFGGSLTVGKSFSYFWRGEVEAGNTGTFIDKGQGIEFNFSTPYVLVNALHDFKNNIYMGASLGAAFPTTTLDWENFLPGSRKKTSISPMAGLIIGLSHRLDYRFILDLRYRLAGFYGSKHTVYLEADPEEDGTFEKYFLDTTIDFVLDNQLSVGLRYEF